MKTVRRQASGVRRKSMLALLAFMALGADATAQLTPPAPEAQAQAFYLLSAEDVVARIEALIRDMKAVIDGQRREIDQLKTKGCI